MALLTNDTPKRTRLRLLSLSPRGTLGAGKETGLGAGGDEPLLIKVPSTQSVPALRVQLQTAGAAATDLYTIDQAGNIGTLSGVAQSIQQTQVTLTAANLAAMNGAPVAILAAPGAGKAIVVQQILFEMKRTATAYTGGGVISCQYHTTTTSVPHAGTIPATVLTTAGAATTLSGLWAASGANGLVIPANEGIDITNATAAFATGTGTAIVYISYSILTLG